MLILSTPLPGQGVGVKFTNSNDIIIASGNELPSTSPAVTQHVVDNAAPVFTSAATANINEDVANNFVAYDANTTDVAGGVVYTLKAVGDHADFSINSGTGVVTIDASPDHEAKETYNFTVRATDRFGFQSEKAITLTINDLNEMPNIAITPTSTDFKFNEDNATGDGSGAVSINPTSLLSDEDNSGASSANDRIDTATVKITDEGAEGCIKLSGSHANVAASYDASNFTLTLTAQNSYTIAEMQAAINAVKYKNTTDEPFEGQRTVEFVVNDGALNSNVVSETIIVNDPTNDTPFVTAASSANTFTEREGPSDTSVAFGTNAIIVDSGSTVAPNRDDTQEGDVVSAVVEIMNAKAGDVLSYENTAGITKDTTNSTATKLVLNATDQNSTTTAQFEAALQTVKFNNTSETPDNTDRNIKFIATTKASTGGESAESHSDIRVVKVIPTNDKPVIDMDNPGAGTQPYTGNNLTQLILLIRQLRLLRCRVRIKLRMRRHLGRLFRT